MKHATFDALPDQFGLGQETVCRIAMKIATEDMGSCFKEAFRAKYVVPEWRAMRRRQFYAARADYDRAKAILQGLRRA